MQNIHHKAARLNRGITLVECLCVTSILATSVGLGMPSLRSWQERQALVSAAMELETDVQYARSEAVARGMPIHITVRQTLEGACYVMHSGQPDDCTCSSDTRAGAVCTGAAAQLRYAAFPQAGTVKLLNNSTTLTFNGKMGTVTPTATFKMQAAPARMHQVVSIMGRTRSCTPDKIPGIKAC